MSKVIIGVMMSVVHLVGRHALAAHVVERLQRGVRLLAALRRRDERRVRHGVGLQARGSQRHLRVAVWVNTGSYLNREDAHMNHELRPKLTVLFNCLIPYYYWVKL